MHRYALLLSTHTTQVPGPLLSLLYALAHQAVLPCANRGSLTGIDTAPTDWYMGTSSSYRSKLQTLLLQLQTLPYGYYKP